MCTTEEYSTLFDCAFFKKCKDTGSSKAAGMECLKEFCGDDEYKEYHHALQCRKIKAMEQIVHILFWKYQNMLETMNNGWKPNTDFCDGMS